MRFLRSLGMLAAAASLATAFTPLARIERFSQPSRQPKYKNKGGRKSWSLRMKIERVRESRKANVRRRQLERLKRGKRPRNNHLWW